MDPRHRLPSLRFRRANARRAVPRNVVCTASLQWLARMAEGGTVTRVGELQGTPAYAAGSKMRDFRGRAAALNLPFLVVQNLRPGAQLRLAGSNKRSCSTM